MAQLVEHPTSAQVMISWFMSLSPESGSGLMAQSLEPTLDSVSPSLSACPQSCSVSLCFSKINVGKTILKRDVSEHYTLNLYRYKHKMYSLNVLQVHAPLL